MALWSIDGVASDDGRCRQMVHSKARFVTPFQAFVESSLRKEYTVVRAPSDHAATALFVTGTGSGGAEIQIWARV